MGLPWAAETWGLSVPFGAGMGAIVGSLLTIGGVCADMTSGACYKLNAEQVHVPLIPVRAQ